MSCTLTAPENHQSNVILERFGLAELFQLFEQGFDNHLRRLLGVLNQNVADAFQSEKFALAIFGFDQAIRIQQDQRVGRNSEAYSAGC
jgi:hypothetical protein